MSVETAFVCDLCGKPASKGLKLGGGHVILCDEHHAAAKQAIRESAKNALHALGGFIKSRYPKIVQAAELLVRIAN